ncbi:hypothetical protein [Pseudooceanicola sp. 200-1SW]|uniref:hypothetical protein n=1 Tax=Pseudooceanicola sp. 200-1SW TaxID=3425949 RepID=UPI003D7F54BA
MPSPAERAPVAASAPLPSLCIFGDSHIASVKHALDAGLLPLVAEHLEFWGAYGPAFRALEFRDNTILPGDEAARDMALRINGAGRGALGGADFAGYLFYGARLRMADFMPPLLETLCTGGHLSAAVQEKVARRFLRGTKAYRIACEFARATPGLPIAFAPAPLLTLGVGNPGRLYPAAAGATADQREAIRLWLDRAAARDGLRLLHQPEDTITGGYWTAPAWASEEAGQEDDPVHKNAAFAARMVTLFRDSLGG